MQPGTYTAIITPFTPDGQAIDYEGLQQLVEFQIQNNITGILAVGTTGESPTLEWEEHNKVVEKIAAQTKNRVLCIAGTGSNNTKEAIIATSHAAKAGVDGVLLVDPYYNGPSSLEIRKEYITPVAKAFPDLTIIPYVIPGRTGTQLLPQDLAILNKEFNNINIVKEATGKINNMKLTRECCGPDYIIFSGDDAMTFQMLSDPLIKAAGVISVITNVAPKAVGEMVKFLLNGDLIEAKKMQSALAPLFDLVTVKTMEKTPYGEVEFRARNPLAIKTLMAILGMPAGPCRRPLGKMSKSSLDVVLNTARQVQNNSPEIFQPVAEYFKIDIAERLNNPSYLANLFYKNSY